MLKKTVIKITETVFLAMFLLSVFACSISFAETVHSYNISKTENDSVVAELEATNDNTYILTISGNGFMKSFDNNPEWYADYSDKISSVVVEAGIKNIVLVLGYKKEAFFYLENKYEGIKIVINP